MCTELPSKLKHPPLTRLCDLVMHPLDAFANIIRHIIHCFKSKRDKAPVVEVSNQPSVCHSNFSGSEDVAVTTYALPSRQAATCLTLDCTPPSVLASFIKALGLIICQVFILRLLAITVLLRKLPFFHPLLVFLPRLGDFSHGHFKTCPQTGQSSAPSSHSHRRRDEKRQDKKGKQRQRGDRNGDNPNEEGNDGSRKPDGLRFPQFDPEVKLFDCPFHKYDPARYQSCRGYSRLCDLKQHIERQHVLGEGKYYCTRCRIEFVQGNNPEASRDRHRRARACLIATIEEAGVILPEEYDSWKEGLKHIGRSVDKWNYIWSNIFHSDPPSPHVEDVVSVIANGYRNRAIDRLPWTMYEILVELGCYRDNEQACAVALRIIDCIFGPLTLDPDPSSS
ncbi:hypothetical protein NCS57_01366400 [Fusarium keratoplasticum]|uniref:Uncharacterized protein n=1 Tax=Fusarium keratoplasticum TaxID=1328300 RepID=A0ACC0QDF6_9HYPO|nr:hypothetical protein NCS57_01366400 [Fusarium keratoplasticum]KAI8650332.1 hypothetical protein NCS57_01366400 [Fusarium keratoplasticum]